MANGNKLKIREAKSIDAATLTEFNRLLARETERLELDPSTVASGVENLLRDSTRGFYLLAETNDSVVGALMVTFEWSDWRDANFWWIQSVYVRQDFRQRGVYRKLHEHVCDLARRSNSCGIRLYVEKENLVAQKTYANLGMTEARYKVFETDLTRPAKPFSSGLPQA